MEHGSFPLLLDKVKRYEGGDIKENVTNRIVGMPNQQIGVSIKPKFPTGKLERVDKLTPLFRAAGGELIKDMSKLKAEKSRKPKRNNIKIVF